MDAVERALLALGVRKGERVALFAENRPEWLHIEHAVAAIGACLVPLNTMLRARELRHILTDSNATTLIWGGRVLGKDTIPLLRELLDGSGERGRLPDLRTTIGLGDGDFGDDVVSWESFLADGARVPDETLRQAEAAVSGDDVALVVYTSGTTGRPKGAMLRHYGVVNKIRTWSKRLSLTSDDASIFCSGLFWTFGCTMYALHSLLSGMHTILHRRFDAGDYLRDSVEHRATIMQIVPAHQEQLLRHPDVSRFDLSAYRVIGIGGASSRDLASRLLALSPRAQVHSSYGLTEGTAVNTWTRVGDRIEKVQSTVGVAADDNDVAVVDPASGRPVPPGTVGELTIRGPNVMAGYLNDPVRTAEALRHGWLYTGDLAVADERGYFSIVGRRIDAYKRAGANVYPAEIESLLDEHPEVVRSAIIGVPDELLGQAGVAFVVRSPGSRLTADEVRAYCRGQLASYKVPDQVRFVDELPMTVSGKVQKHRLAEEWAARAEEVDERD